MKARLTFHAANRLSERTALSDDVFFCLIENYRCVIVGIEPRTNRLHKLFYSEPDKSHFVAIQDMATGHVITVLPLDYHKKLSWKITEKKLKQAVYRVSPALRAALYPTEKMLVVPGIKCVVTVVIVSSGLHAILKNIGSHRFSACPTDAGEALGDPEFVEKITLRLRKRNVPIAAVEEILLINNKREFLLKIPWDTIDEFKDDIEISEVE